MIDELGQRRRAFTLLELLVVITIIVILLALLTPALDQAIYQAELAVCGARLKTLSTTMIVYTADSRRQYIWRYVRQQPVGTRPNLVRIGGAPDWADDRPLLSKYMSLDTLVDPLVDAIKLDEANNSKDTYIYTPYVLWAGWQYDGERGMIRLGDRFTYDVTLGDEGRKGPHRFNVLASDMDWSFTNGQQIGTSHPEDAGVAALTTLQNSHPLFTVMGVNVAQPHTLSSWETSAGYRGTTDLNHAFDDGSVQRFEKVIWRDDPRMRSVSIHNGHDDTYGFYIPPAR